MPALQCDKYTVMYLGMTKESLLFTPISSLVDNCIEERTSDRPPNPLDAPNNLHTSDMCQVPPSQKISLKIGNNPITTYSFDFLHLSYHRRPDLRLSFVLLVRRSSDDALPMERKL